MTFTESINNYMADNECPHCEAGQVHLRIGNEHVETIKCDTCSGRGWLAPNERAAVMDGVRALSAAMAERKL